MDWWLSTFRDYSNTTWKFDKFTKTVKKITSYLLMLFYLFIEFLFSKNLNRYLNNNQLSGDIPTQLGNLRNLEYL